MPNSIDQSAANAYSLTPPYPSYGFHKGDVVIDQYKNYVLVDANGVIQIVDPIGSKRHTPDLDQSLLTHRHKPLTITYSEQCQAAKRFIDDLIQRKEQPTENLLIVGQTNVSALIKRFQEADWYFDYSDDFQVWQKAGEEIAAIKKELTELSADPTGWQLANQIWQHYAAPFSNEQPEFLRLYPQAPPGEIDPQVLEAYKQDYQQRVQASLQQPLHGQQQGHTR